MDPMDPLGMALELAYRVIDDTINPYIGEYFSLTLEAKVHGEVNKNLSALDSEFIFDAQTVFDFKTQYFVTTLNVKRKGSPTKEKPVTVRRQWNAGVSTVTR